MRAPDRPTFAGEAPLVIVHVVLVATFARLFTDGAFLAPLLVVVLAAHALAIGARAVRAPVLATVGLAVIGGGLVLGWTFFADTHTWALVPGGETIDAASAALRQARADYPEVIAPTEATTGFLLVSAAALWLAVWFADWAAHRLHAIAEAVGPATAIFVFCSVLGGGDHRVASAAAFGAAVLLFVGMARAEEVHRQQPWLPSAPRTTAALRRSAMVVGAVAVLAGTLVGPRLPGADDPAVIDWRQGDEGSGSRVTVSPMVELRRRIVEQRDLVVFEVEASEPAYWRLTSLDRFDGEIWSSTGEFEAASDELSQQGPEAPDGEEITQEFEIEALATLWAPSAFTAVAVPGSDERLRWDPESATLIVDSSKETSDGLTYEVVSRAPTLDPEVLSSVRGLDPPDVKDRYEGLPGGFPSIASDAAREVTAGAPDRYAQALALQDWFRTEFEYSLDEAPTGHSDSALEEFLTDRVGYCEQFAGAYAAMARSLGIPARVAVGFTPGNADPDRPGVYRVLGRHAHAWPEVWFPEVGWVPFEPTPQRGIPGAERYTGVPPQQDAGSGSEEAATSTTTAPTTAVAEAPPDDAAPESPQEPSETRTTGDDQPAVGGDEDSRPWWQVAVGIALLVGFAAAALAWVRRRRPRHSAPVGPVEVAWARATASLAAREVRGDGAETPLELAARAARELDLDDRERAELGELAALVTEDRWSAAGLDPDGVARVERLAERVEAAGVDRPVEAAAR